MEEVVSLQDILLILKKRLLLIFMTTVLGIVTLAGITFFLITPKYGTSAQLVVQSNQQNATGTNLQSDLTGNVMMVNTYKDLIKSDVVLDQVASQLVKENGMQYSSSELNQMISVTQSQNSQMFAIQVISGNARASMVIANKTATIFKECAVDILKVDKVSIISLAKLKSNPVSPNKQLNLLIGAVIGLMLGVMIAFILEFLDKTVKDDKFIGNELGLSLLGEISILSNKELQSATIVNASQEQTEDLDWAPEEVAPEKPSVPKTKGRSKKKTKAEAKHVEMLEKKRRARQKL